MKNNKEFLQDLGMKIRVHRTMRGLTSKEVAEKCGYDKGALSQIELGKKNCHIITLKDIAEAMGMDIFQLMSYPLE